jgi:hypothetical protein
VLPLCPNQRTLFQALEMTESCHNLTFIVSIEHLVRLQHQRQRHIDT